MIVPLVSILLLKSVSSMKWETGFDLGNITESYQPVWLTIDVNAPHTILYNARLKNGSWLYSGYDQNLSPFYRQLNGTLNHTFSSLRYDVESHVSGIYVADKAHDQRRDWFTDVSFGLADVIDGDEPTHTRGYGVLGLSRSRRSGSGFRDLFLRYGATYCHACDCRKSGTSLYCEGVFFHTSEGSSTTFDRFEDSVFLTSAPASNQNPDGWTFDLQGSAFGKYKSRKPFNLTFSTTTKYLTVPNSFYNAVAKELKPQSSEYGVPVVDCSLYKTAEPIELVFGERKLFIDPVNYMNTIGKGVCELRIRGGAPEGTWFVGESFSDSFGICLDYDAHRAWFYKVPLIDKHPEQMHSVRSFEKTRRLSDGTMKRSSAVVF